MGLMTAPPDSTKAKYVPKERTKIARRFNAGTAIPMEIASRMGRLRLCAKINRPLRDEMVFGLFPGVKTPGYCRMSLAGQKIATCAYVTAIFHPSSR